MEAIQAQKHYLNQIQFLELVVGLVKRFEKEYVRPATLREYSLAEHDVGYHGGNGTNQTPYLLTLPALPIDLVPHSTWEKTFFFLPPQSGSIQPPTGYYDKFPVPPGIGAGPEFYRRQKFRLQGRPSVQPLNPHPRFCESYGGHHFLVLTRLPHSVPPIWYTTPPSSVIQNVDYTFPLKDGTAHTVYTRFTFELRTAPRRREEGERAEVFAPSGSGDAAAAHEASASADAAAAHEANRHKTWKDVVL